MVTRAEHRRATLIALGDAAVGLFEAEGPSVTIDSIADSAGLARRTVFRYVSSKEELAFVNQLIWLDVFDAALRADQSTTLVERLRTCSRCIAGYIDANSLATRRAMRVVALHPELGRGLSRIMQSWIDRVAFEVADFDGEENDSYSELRARVIGAALMGMVDATLREWSASPAGTAFTPLYDQGFAIVEVLFGE